MHIICLIYNVVGGGGVQSMEALPLIFMYVAIQHLDMSHPPSRLKDVAFKSIPSRPKLWKWYADDTCCIQVTWMGSYITKLVYAQNIQVR